MSAPSSRPRGMAELSRPQPRAIASPGTAAGERRLGGALLVPLDQIVPDPDQPRRDWQHDDGERRLEELAASMREFGVLQPLLVREDGTLEDGRTRYVVIAGGRRRAAAERAELGAVPVVVRGDEGSRVRVLQLLENLQRQALSPLDEARAYQELIDTEGLTPPGLAGRVHVSAQHVRDRLRLLADQVVSDAVARRQISIRAARDILQLPDDEVWRFKERIAGGEELRTADVMAVRARLKANGVLNPRSKGGGHAGGDGTRAADPAGIAAQPIPPEQTRFVNPAPTVPEQTGFVNPPPTMPEHDRPVQPPVAAGADPPDPPHHPAATAAVAARLGEFIWQALPVAARDRLAADLRELERGEPPSEWWPAVYRGLRRQFAPDE